MTKNMKKYLELVSNDKELQKKVQKVEAEYKEKLIKEAIKLAGEHGITLVESDFAMETPTGELSDDELDAVAGGGKCGCILGGGGPGDERVPACGCVAGGWGDKDAKSIRCACPLYGMGDEGYY